MHHTLVEQGLVHKLDKPQIQTNSVPHWSENISEQHLQAKRS